MPTLLIAAGLVAAAHTVPSNGAAQASDFRWSGALAQGTTIEIRGVNGSIRAVASPDGNVHVEASRTARRSDPQSVRVELVEHAGGVTICAVYPTVAGEARQNECRPGGGANSVRNNDVQVDFVVRVPAGVAFAGSTVNGGVEAGGLQSDVTVATVNGHVDVQTTGFVSSVSTVNGDVRLTLPAGTDADFRGSTVNGSIESDFPLVIQGAAGPRAVRGTLGQGGRELRVSTVNGDIVLRRG